MKQTRRLSLLTAALSLCLFQVHAQNTSPYWSLAGNSNATTSSKLGTTNGVSLRFYAGNVQRMVIAYTTGNVGIGTSTLPARFTVQNNGSTPSTRWINSSTQPLFAGFGESPSGSGDFVLGVASGSASVRPVLLGRRSRGTLAAPTMVANNDNLATLLASGYDGTSFQNGASMDFQVDGTPASGKVPTRISFYTGSNSSTRTERLRIGSTGEVSVGTNTQAVADMALQARGISIGVLGRSIGINGNESTGTGVQGNGNVGVSGYGEGNSENDGKGVYGFAFGVGVEGDGYSGVGVHGHADSYGVRGNAEWTGVYGESGIYYGVVGKGGRAGVTGIGSGGGEGAYGGDFSSSDGDGLHATTSHAGSYAGVFTGNVYASGIFQSSDGNLKQNVQEFTGAMDIINKLKPRNYEFKGDAKLAVLNLPKGKHYGLIAQDVEEVLPELVKEVRQNLTILKAADFTIPTKSAVQTKPQPAPPQSIATKAANYTELIPIMIKGMQEQQQENEELKEQVAELRQMVLELKRGSSGAVTSLSGSLEQNAPNPVRGSTTIRFHIGEQATSARMELTNAKGQVVKTLILNKGQGQVALNTTALAAGTYNYTLYVDGKQVDTKRLVIAR